MNNNKHIVNVVLLVFWSLISIYLTLLYLPAKTFAQQSLPAQSPDLVNSIINVFGSMFGDSGKAPNAEEQQKQYDTLLNDPRTAEELMKLPTATPLPNQETPTENTTVTSKNNFVFYCQGNPAWRDVCSLGSGGCGPSSMAMALTYLGITMTPPQVDKIFQQNGWRSCSDAGSYMTAALYSDWLKGLGITITPDLSPNGTLDLKQAKRYIENGFIIIASSRSFPCVNCKSAKRIDHIFVVDNVEPTTGSVSIRDPNNCSYTNGNDEKPENVNRFVSSFPWLYAFGLKKN